VIHNLRCVLDHLVWQLVLLNEGKTGHTFSSPLRAPAPGTGAARETGPARGSTG
jgi:hypothetical protein